MEPSKKWGGQVEGQVEWKPGLRKGSMEIMVGESKGIGWNGSVFVLTADVHA